MNTNSISVQLGTETSLSARMETETSLSAGLATEASFAGQLGTGAAVVNDYLIRTEEIEDGHRLTIRRGSEVQSIDVMNGAKGDPGEDAPQEAVLYTPQSLTEEQQAQVRENIGIAEQGDVITYEVGPGRQFESFTDCLRALEDNEQSKRIDIYEGSYDIYSELGGQTNPVVPPNTEIVGHGRVELMASDGSDLSIVNLSGSAKLKNLMITCSVGYACVRANGPTLGKYDGVVWEIENCALEYSKAEVMIGGGGLCCVDATLRRGVELHLRNTVCKAGTYELKGTVLKLTNRAIASNVSPRVRISDCVLDGGIDLYSHTSPTVNPFTVVDVQIENSHITGNVYKEALEESSHGFLVDCFRVTYINTPHTSRSYGIATHEAHAETVEIFRILKRISPETRIVGYVPIGVKNVGSDSNLSMDELKNRVDLWQAIGADGIFLDEYGYDYGVTRARQNEIVRYCHDRGMFVFANSWSIEYCFSDEDIVIDWMEDFHPNPDGLRAVLNAEDYYVYEHLFYNSYHDSDGNLHVECAEPYRIDNILQYFNDARIDGMSYREVFGTKVFSLDAIPTGASLREKNEMMSLSIIGAAILNIDAIAFGDDMWSSSGNYHQWDFPQLNLATDGLNSISRNTRTYTDAEGKTAEFTYRWAASINGNQYAIVFDVETPTDVDYAAGKRYAECNGVQVDNAWLTIYDFQEFMEQTSSQVEANTTLVNEAVQKVEAALPNALRAEEKVNSFMTESNARIEGMEARVNSAISDIEVLTKGFNYLEVEW